MLCVRARKEPGLMPFTPTNAKHFGAMGGKLGGSAGGGRKVRGDSDHYRALVSKRSVFLVSMIVDGVALPMLRSRGLAVVVRRIAKTKGRGYEVSHSTKGIANVRFDGTRALVTWPGEDPVVVFFKPRVCRYWGAPAIKGDYAGGGVRLCGECSGQH